MPHKILFTIPNFITAGSGQALVNIVSRLDRQRFEPAVCVLKKGGRLDQELVSLGIPLLEHDFTLPPKPYVSLPTRAWRAAGCFRPHRFALWHSFHYSDDYTEALVARFSGAKAWIYTKKNMGWGSRAWQLRSLLAARIAAQNSDMLRLFFATDRMKAKTRLIPRGVDCEKFSPHVQPRLALRSSLGLGAETPLAAVVAHLVPVKGHPTLIRAFSRVQGAHLLMVGKPMDAGYAAGLEGEVASLGLAERVHFLGGVQDVAALLAEVDIFLLPTGATGRMEGCPVALLEAMASGKACLATDIPGSRDLIVHGESGMLVPPGDPDALAAALRALLADPNLRQRLGRAARARVEDRFTIEREVAAHEALYSEILGMD